MKILSYILFSCLLFPSIVWSQPKSPKLDSFDKLRQTILLGYIRQLSGKDSTGLNQKQVYYFYFEPPAEAISPHDEEESRLGQLKSDKTLFIRIPSEYCSCKSATDIKALPYRYFRRSHPREYELIEKDDFLWPALNSTAFLVYCPAKKGRKNQIIAAVWFWPSTRIGLISSTIPEKH
ncbi:hypothetical protein [Arsenicibacter rosenii]|nr:hypothetical protein [Arsenicibacter rosenii]